ncbi:hypothetical protein AGOR_G00203750 [Albula goreensis]|uniref:SH3 domain-containing protein n=1 Tax=Albula goreensis TaxID=1534307 RepID=A0A8T3CX53_9TELE|nr:hypothetical protein AGOR_G00203750 [Albula goreensis]
MEPGSVVRAVFEFLPSVSEELPLFTGDVIEVLSVVDEFWLLGNKDGVTGQFPSTFVELVSVPSTKPGERLYVCINDFSSLETGNLPLKRGDVVVGEGSVDAAWLRGRNSWGSRGIVPVSCLKELRLSVRSRQLSQRVADAEAATSDLPSHALGQARALMGLSAQLEEELDFREGDIITIVGLPEPGWYEGELEGRRGVFPEGFVELLAPLRLGGAEQEAGPYDMYEEREESAQVEEVATSAEEEDEEDEEEGVYGVALYDFRAMEPGELDFNVGDRIRVVGTLEDGWLEGRLRGRSGIFPHRFVRIESPQPAAEPEAEEPPTQDSALGPEEEETVPPAVSHDDGPDWSVQEDHTVWDLDYFEQRAERNAMERKQTDSRFTGVRPAAPDRGQARGGMESTRRTWGAAPVPPTHRELQRTSSASPTPPTKPRLPPRPSLHSLTNRLSFGQKNGSDLSDSDTPPAPATRTLSLLATTQNGQTNGRSSGCDNLPGRGEGRSPRKIFRHASVTDSDLLSGRECGQWAWPKGRGSNGLSGSFTLESLSASARDLDTELSQQLAAFERSLPGSLLGGGGAGGGASTGKETISRHFSILDYSSESDIIRGSSHSPACLQPDTPPCSSSSPSSLERRKVLRPPPPRPRMVKPQLSRAPPAGSNHGHPPPFRPARPAPRPPPPCPRRDTHSPRTLQGTSQTFYTQEEEEQEEAEPEAEAEAEMDQSEALEREREQEQYALLLRLQEVERDMEMYSHTMEELRIMLEEEEDETARAQALENLEFCTYTLDTLALEQQQLRELRSSYFCLSHEISILFHCKFVLETA